MRYIPSLTLTAICLLAYTSAAELEFERIKQSLVLSWQTDSNKLQTQDDALTPNSWTDHPKGSRSPVTHSLLESDKKQVFFRLAPKSFELAETATLLDHQTLTETGYCSDGTDRPASDGSPRFDGPMEAPILTYNNYQYIAYYEATGELIIARRPFSPQGNWEKTSLDGFLMTSQDRHNKITLGISPGDGRIHISYDHHNTPVLNYAATAPGVANTPSQANWDQYTFTQAPNLGLDINPDLVTYPDFVEVTGTGNIIVYWRSGGAIGGEMNIAHYDSSLGAWDFIGRFTSRDGYYKGNYGTRGPYTAQLQSDASGTIQVAWLWREDFDLRGGDFRYGNHGLYYARSHDGGFAWNDSWGKQIADTRRGETISIDNIGPEAYEIPMESEPTNSNITSAVDTSTGEYHVMVLHNVGETSKRANHHYIRQTNGDWIVKSSTLPSGDGTTLAFHGDKLFAFIGTGIQYSERSDGFSNWTQLSMPSGIGSGQFRWDTARLPDGLVSLSVQRAPDTRGAPSPIEVYDFSLK